MNIPILVLLIYLFAVNLTAFALMGADKLRAKKGYWRIPERTLFLAALAGGSLGGMAGMYLFRHKTLHTAFRIGFPLLFVLQVAAVIAAIVLLARRAGNAGELLIGLPAFPCGRTTAFCDVFQKG